MGVLSNIKFAVQRLRGGSGRPCTHVDQIRDVAPTSEGCEQCIAMDDTWVHLRTCMTCGQVGCCDSSVSLPARNSILFQAALSPAGAASYALTT